MTVYRSEHMTVHVTSDEMSALLSVSARGNDFPSQDEIEATLKAAGVVVGVNHGLIKKILDNQNPVQGLVIAVGETAFSGEPDRLVWSIDISKQHQPKIKVNGKADFKQLHQFEVVKQGDEIVSLLPGKAATPEITVTGKEKMTGEALVHLVIPAGKNTRLSEDGLTLYADIDGVAMLKKGIIIVDNVFHIHGDVDFSTGNINYQGTVIIEGDVRSGFRVESTDSIYINGSVEAAEIYSKNGSIIIRDGVLGRDRARILAGDDFNCGFIQDATASVKNDVIIKHYAINSQITSGGKVTVIENEGLIRGGKTVAERGIEVLVAGSDHKILTEMVLIRSDIGDEQSKLWQAKIKLAEEYQHLDSLKKRLEFLDLLKQRLTTISTQRDQEILKLQEKTARAEDHIEVTRQDIELLAQDSMDQSPDHAVRIRERLHPKVTVTIGHKKYYSSSIKGGVNIYRNGNELLIEPNAEA